MPAARSALAACRNTLRLMIRRPNLAEPVVVIVTTTVFCCA